jgi:ATP-dependent Clp protease ATP-binding subunit ClpX
MDKLLPVNALSVESRELLTKFRLCNKEKTQIVKNIADSLTYEATTKLMIEIIESGEDYQCEFDKITWCVRMAYVTGFAKAIDSYSDVIEMSLRGKGIDSHDNNIVVCSFCGKSKEQAKKLVAGSENIFICDTCAEVCARFCEVEENLTEIDCISGQVAIPTPMQIHKSLDEYIIGQVDAKKSFAVATYNHYKRIALLEQNLETNIQKSNILLLGPSGSGKTYIAQTMAKLLNVPFAIADATSLTESGYVGEDVETVLQKLIQAADYDIEQAQRGIVFIDEIDKIARNSSNFSNRRDVGGESVQQALLKIIEGNIATVPLKGTHKDSKSDCVQLDTTNILFICGGAFDGIDKIIEQRLNKNVIGFAAEIDNTDDIIRADIDKQADTEDLQRYGLIPELIGRLPVIVSLNPLDEDALISILTEPKNSIIEQYKQLLKIDNVSLEFTDNAIIAIAKQAIVRKTGARGLRNIIEKIMRDVMYEIPSKKGYTEKVIITRETVTDMKAAEIIYKKEQTKIKI